MKRMEPHGEPQPTVLVVDDSPNNVHILGELLHSEYVVRVATNGERALRAAHQRPIPDLILLDIMMPGIDGYEVLSRLREDQETAEIPVIFITALDMPAQEERGLRLGAVDYITKPFGPAVVQARVKTHIELASARRRLAAENVLLEQEVAVRTEKLRHAQAQLVQSEKMAAIGVLSAGIAHEINNPLAYVSSNLETLGGYLEELFALVNRCREIVAGFEGRERMEAAIAAAWKEADLDYLREDADELRSESREGFVRIKKIIQDLSQFSRAGKEDDWRPADLHAGLDSTLNIAHHVIKKKAEVVKNYGDIPPVECLSSQINQVFMNLVINAAQAIDDRGVITLSSGTDGDYVWFEIRDTGKGIDPEDASKIFDPFFTTKPVGQGTGLGLALVYNIVQKHRGDIEVQSEPGRGSSFRIRLPVHHPAGESGADEV